MREQLRRSRTILDIGDDHLLLYHRCSSGVHPGWEVPTVVFTRPMDAHNDPVTRDPVLIYH